MTPAERRARAAPEKVQADRKHHFKKASKKLTRHVKEPSRLKLALKPFSEELLVQLENELTKKTRSELFRKIKFTSKVGSKGKSKEIKKQSLKIAKKKFSDKIKAVVLKKKIGIKEAAKKLSACSAAKKVTEKVDKEAPKEIEKPELTEEVKEAPKEIDQSEHTEEVEVPVLVLVVGFCYSVGFVILCMRPLGGLLGRN